MKARNKTVLFIILTVCAVLVGASLLYAASGTKKNAEVFIDGQPITLDVSSVIRKKTVFIPLIKACEEMGGLVSWDADEQKATVTLAGRTIECAADSQTMLYREPGQTNDTEATAIQLETPPILLEECFLVPLSVFTEGLGVSAQYDSKTDSVTMRSPAHILITAPQNAYLTGQKDRLTVKVFPAGADQNCTFSSDHPDVIHIEPDGAFECLSVGSAVITASGVDGVTGFVEIGSVDLEAFEKEVFALTNAEREKEGFAPFLEGYRELNETAETRAEEILTLFSHARPNGTSCFTAFYECGINQDTAVSENLAYSQKTPAEVVQAWMDSPTHKANILRENMKYLSVGIRLAPDGMLYWVQSFSA